MVYYIYRFTNLVNNKIYIGSTNDFKKRYRQHKFQSTSEVKYKLHKAINKYGIQNFRFEVLIETNEESVDQLEQFYIDLYNSTNDKFGYNAVGVLKGQRKLISSCMRNEWKDPKKRQNRLEKMKEGSMKKSIIAVSIYDGSYTIYESVHDAGRDGYSYSCIYPCLQGERKTGQKCVWFYYDSNPEQYVKKAEEILGGFKNEYYKPIIATNKITGEQLHFSSTFTLEDKGFKPKAVRRVLRDEREGYAGYYWKYA